jgi:hypothetical protein
MHQPLKKLLNVGTNALALYLVIHPQALSLAHLFFCRIGFRFASVFTVVRKSRSATNISSGGLTPDCVEENEHESIFRLLSQ